MDNGLVQFNKLKNRMLDIGLNPCCSGQWTRTADDVAFTLMATES